MAVELLSDNLSSALATTYASKLVRVWNRLSVLLANIQIVPSYGQGSGKQIGWDVQTSGAAAATFTEGADVGAGEFAHDIEVPATLAWGQYRSTFAMSNLELNAAAANIGNATELERILEERFFDSCAKITSKINQDAIAGTGASNSMIGLTTALLDSGSYANIDPTTYTEWKGNVNANGGTARPLSLDLLAKAEQSQYTASGKSAELLLATPGIKTKYEGLFNSVQRVMAPNGSGSPIQRMDASSEDLYWRGKPLIRDKDMTAGYLMGLVASEIELHVLPWAPVPDMTPVVARDLVSSNGEQMANLAPLLHVYPLARTGSAVKFVVEIYCQLKVRRRNAHFMIKDISET